MDPRPSGHGVSKLHPGDHEILRHPAVLLAKDFEAPTLEDLKTRWNEIENQQETKCWNWLVPIGGQPR